MLLLMTMTMTMTTVLRDRPVSGRPHGVPATHFVQPLRLGSESSNCATHQYNLGDVLWTHDLVSVATLYTLLRVLGTSGLHRT